MFDNQYKWFEKRAKREEPNDNSDFCLRFAVYMAGESDLMINADNGPDSSHSLHSTARLAARIHHCIVNEQRVPETERMNHLFPWLHEALDLRSVKIFELALGYTCAKREQSAEEISRYIHILLPMRYLETLIVAENVARDVGILAFLSKAFTQPESGDRESFALPNLKNLHFKDARDMDWDALAGMVELREAGSIALEKLRLSRSGPSPSTFISERLARAVRTVEIAG